MAVAHSAVVAASARGGAAWGPARHGRRRGATRGVRLRARASAASLSTCEPGTTTTRDSTHPCVSIARDWLRRKSSRCVPQCASRSGADRDRSRAASLSARVCRHSERETQGSRRLRLRSRSSKKTRLSLSSFPHRAVCVRAHERERERERERGQERGLVRHERARARVDAHCGLERRDGARNETLVVRVVEREDEALSTTGHARCSHTEPRA